MPANKPGQQSGGQPPVVHRQSQYPAQFLAVLHHECHLLLVVHRAELFKRCVHGQIYTGYLYLHCQCGTMHRQPEPQRRLSERHLKILKREGNAHVQQGFRSLSLDLLDDMRVHQPSAGVLLISYGAPPAAGLFTFSWHSTFDTSVKVNLPPRFARIVPFGMVIV